MSSAIECLTSLHDVPLLHKLRDTYELLRYYESPEAQWASETMTKAAVREKFDALKHEAARRNLPFMECLQ